jgi:transcriptional regulator with XRE-family HTH domain
MRDHTMERPGTRLKQVREKLGLTYRHVERASQGLAARHGNDEYAIALSRLADIENKGTVPTIYRLYSLCSIYGLDLIETLRWYGIPVEMMGSEALRIPHDQTHPLDFHASGPFTIPQPLEKSLDFNQTTFLSQVIKRWGKAGLSFLNGWDLRQHRFGLIGLEDWSMHPVLHPGSLVLIDQNRRRIAAGGWTSELERPIYFLEHRSGYRCGWCSLSAGTLIVQPHPSAQEAPEVFAASEIDVIGQVTGVAMLLESRKRRHTRSGAGPAASPNP